MQLNDQRRFSNSNKAAYITNLPPQSMRLASTRSHMDSGSEALHSRITCGAENNCHHGLLDLPKLRNGSLDLMESGLDSKVFALAWHIAKLYSASKDSASYKDNAA